MELAHVVVAVGAVLGHGAHAVLERQGEVTPEAVGLERAGGDDSVRLLEQAGKEHAAAPVAAAERVSDPVPGGQLVEHDRREAELLPLGRDALDLHHLARHTHAAPVRHRHPAGSRGAEPLHEGAERVGMGGPGEGIDGIEIRLHHHVTAAQAVGGEQAQRPGDAVPVILGLHHDHARPALGSGRGGGPVPQSKRRTRPRAQLKKLASVHSTSPRGPFTRPRPPAGRPACPTSSPEAPAVRR